MAIFKSKNFKTDFQCEKLKTTKILRQRWDLKTASGVIFFFFLKIISHPARAGKKNEQKNQIQLLFVFFKSSPMMFRTGKLRFYLSSLQQIWQSGVFILTILLPLYRTDNLSWFQKLRRTKTTYSDSTMLGWPPVRRAICLEASAAVKHHIMITD